MVQLISYWYLIVTYGLTYSLETYRQSLLTGLKIRYVWHTNLPGYLSDSIEVVQKRALRTIFPGVSDSEAMEKSNMPTLFDRREELCKKYVTGLKRQDHKLHHLLPPLRNVPYPLRDAVPLVLLQD